MAHVESDTITLPSGVRASIVTTGNRPRIRWGTSGFFDSPHEVELRIALLHRQLRDLEHLLGWIKGRRGEKLKCNTRKGEGNV